RLQQLRHARRARSPRDGAWAAGWTWFLRHAHGGQDRVASRAARVAPRAAADQRPQVASAVHVRQVAPAGRVQPASVQVPGSWPLRREGEHRNQLAEVPVAGHELRAAAAGARRVALRGAVARAGGREGRRPWRDGLLLGLTLGRRGQAPSEARGLHGRRLPEVRAALPGQAALPAPTPARSARQGGGARCRSEKSVRTSERLR
ncbi:unnamed protein product, partial [Prorocentrum cordatum]